MSKFNFTKVSIEGLPMPNKGWSYHYDLKVQGLGIGVGCTGKKSFVFYRKINGKPERLTIGRYPDLTIEQARGKVSELNAYIANGLNPSEIKKKQKKELIFSDLFNDYLERHSKIKKKTWKEDQAQFRLYLNKPLGKKKLTTITRQNIAHIHSTITKAGHPPTANRVKALLSSIFNWGISVGMCEVNPVHGIQGNREKQRDRFIQSDELPKFFKALSEEPNETIRDYILISLLTGARRSNVLSMQWGDINFERAEWRIQETKNGAPQTVTLSPEALEILQKRKKKDDGVFVFPGIGKSGHLEEPKKGWRRILERAGIEDLRIHDLRRTLASWQAKTGASLSIIGKSLNHKNQSTTAIYARLDLDPVRESVNKATSAMMLAAGLKESVDVLPLKQSVDS